MTKNSRKLKCLLMLSLCALFFFMGAVAIHAATYYVATTGNNAHTCTTAQTITTPKRTIASGVACLNPGDTLFIRSGTWTEQIDLQGPNKSGSAGAYITIAGYPGETVTLAGTDSALGYAWIKARGTPSFLIFDNLILDGTNMPDRTGWQIRDGNHDFILRNLEIKNTRYPGVYIEGDNITIQNCTIHDQISENPNTSRPYGIYYRTGANGVIEGNNIYNNPGGGIHAYPGPVTNLTVRRNKIHDNNTIATATSFGGVLIGPNAMNAKVYNNLIYRNGSSPTSAEGQAHGIVAFGVANGTKIWNNTVYGNDGNGIWVQTGTFATAVLNNISYNNSQTNIANSGTGTISSNNLTSNPNFVNVAVFNFDLQTSSPAIDTGVTLSQVTTDFKKTPRPRGAAYDIGAYEVGTGSDDEPPNAPLGLSIR